MAAGVSIKLKRKAGAFSSGELLAGEMGVDVTNGSIYFSTDGSNVKNINDTSLLDWKQNVLNIQTDNTLDPGATPTTGDRYIMENSASLHANFGSPSGLQDDDIVEYDGSVFVVVFDASASGEGAATYNENDNSIWLFTGSAWAAMGGASDHGTLSGLGDDDHTQYALISSQAGAPSSTPSRVGLINIDTTADTQYISTGTASSADWLQIPKFTSTFNNATMVIDGGTI